MTALDKKEIVTLGNLLIVLDLLDNAKIRYWLNGGWIVDILEERQKGEHCNIDINFDSKCTDKLLYILKKEGYEILTDLRPAGIELYHERLGYINIHPFVIIDDDTSNKSGLANGLYELESGMFGTTDFCGRTALCYPRKVKNYFTPIMHCLKWISTVYKS